MQRYRVELENLEIRTVKPADEATHEGDTILEERVGETLFLTLHAGSEAEAREKAERVAGRLKANTSPDAIADDLQHTMQQTGIGGQLGDRSGTNSEDEPGARSSGGVGGGVNADYLRAAAHGDPTKRLDDEQDGPDETDYLDPDDLVRGGKGA